MSRYILSRSLSVPFLAAVIQAALNLKRNEAQTRLKLLKLYKTQAKSRPNPIILKLLKVPANSGIQVLCHSRPQDDKKIMACINSTRTHVLLAGLPSHWSRQAIKQVRLPTQVRDPRGWGINAGGEHLGPIPSPQEHLSYWYRAGTWAELELTGKAIQGLGSLPGFPVLPYLGRPYMAMDGFSAFGDERVLSVESTEINPRRTELGNTSLFVPPAVLLSSDSSAQIRLPIRLLKLILTYYKFKVELHHGPPLNPALLQMLSENGRYVNLAHIEPSKLEAVSPIFTKDTNKWTLSIKGQTATCVPSKYITGVHLSQEFDRVVGVCGMVFHHKGMHAQLNEDELTFGTKSTTADKLAEADSRKVRAEEFKAHLCIPLYDGRGATINAATDIDNLHDILPRYEGNDGEIPNNSCTAVVRAPPRPNNIP
ncbi:hypothetical protein B0H13DRAFT_2268326 [Mycena leptocephala]|nr:hypothetical protein B0H13DRAFT_2268326 [Mycena leptocephala]